MSLIAIIKIAFKSLKRNKTRTFLTMLGIIIGVAAVITMLAIGQGAQKIIDDQISSMGTNVISISSNWGSNRSTARAEAGTGNLLEVEDVEAIREQVRGVRYASVLVRSYGQLKYGSQNWRAQVMGADVDFFDIRDIQVELGTLFNSSHVRSGTKVCVIGPTVAINLFGDEDPIDKVIRIRNIPVTVVGVLKAKGQSVMGGDQDDIVIAPYTMVLTRFTGSRRPMLQVYVSAESKEMIPIVQQEITELLQIRHRDTTSEDFFVRTQTDIAETSQEVSNTMTILLASIAGISLLVGGIGIMNIMLVSVTERIKEIGIRMAVGARKRDVLLQFIIEAVTISILGGLLGILLGLIAARIVSQTMQWSISVTVWSIMLAVSFSCLIGIFFGWYPARSCRQP
ncbi:MAG: ABC transporter permease [Candidatus Cloacimonadaceae bacterium]